MKEIAPIHWETLVNAGWRIDLPAIFVMASNIIVKPVVMGFGFDSDYTAGSSTR